MKKKTKRWLSAFLAMLTVMTSVLGSFSPAYAASPSANIKFWYASVKELGKVTGYNKSHSSEILYAMIDGHTAYCMNFGLAAKGGILMTSDTTPKTEMTDTQEKLLAYCMYYGFSTTEVTAPDNDQKNKYIATQAVVWNIEQNVFGTATADLAAADICAVAPNSTASYAYYETLRDNITKSNNAKRPSFAQRLSSNAATYELKWNESNKRYEASFFDMNNSLSEYNFSISGFSVEKTGSWLKLYTTTPVTTAKLGTFTSSTGAVETTSSCVFWLTGKNGYQEFVSEIPQADPVRAYIKIKTESLGYGQITKTDKSTGTHLKGAVYGIYSDSECKTKVDSMTTDENGSAKSKALSAGTYYVKEITAPKGYVRSDKVYTLTVKAGQTTDISLTDTEQMGSLTIYKEGEMLSSFNGKNFTYTKGKLKGATFKLTAGSDIYKADGTLVFKKGSTVKSDLVTDKDGKVTVSNLRLGTYVVTETKSADGYVLNSTPKTVKIEYKDQTITVQSESTTVNNTRQKASVSILKVDEKTNEPLEGGQFSLYAGNDIKKVTASLKKNMNSGLTARKA